MLPTASLIFRYPRDPLAPPNAISSLAIPIHQQQVLLYFPSPFQPATSQHVASSLGNVSAPQKWKILERIACLFPPLLFPCEVTGCGRHAICLKCKNSIDKIVWNLHFLYISPSANECKLDNFKSLMGWIRIYRHI